MCILSRENRESFLHSAAATEMHVELRHWWNRQCRGFDDSSPISDKGERYERFADCANPLSKPLPAASTQATEKPVMNSIDFIGYLSGFLTTAAFLPQVIRIWRTRSTEDISLGMYWTFNLGVALWLTYGFMIKSPPVIVSNAVTLVLSGAVLVMKICYSEKKPNPCVDAARDEQLENRS